MPGGPRDWSRRGEAQRGTAEIYSNIQGVRRSPRRPLRLRPLLRGDRGPGVSAAAARAMDSPRCRRAARSLERLGSALGEPRLSGTMPARAPRSPEGVQPPDDHTAEAHCGWFASPSSPRSGSILRWKKSHQIRFCRASMSAEPARYCAGPTRSSSALHPSSAKTCSSCVRQ